jgi:nucleobase:cation symporter-1, NCS1 family
MATLWSGWTDVGAHKAIAFGFFWLIQLAIILRGIEGIRWLERTAAPLLIGGSLALLIWGFDAGGGIGNVFSASSKLLTDDQSFWSLFAPGLAANIGYGVFVAFGLAAISYYLLAQAAPSEARAPAVAEAD